MKKLIVLASFFFFCQINAQTWTTEEQYIQKFAKYAVEEMEKYSIPASITLAQGLLETGGGQSRLAKEGNNHFGIKCKKGWKGKTMKHTDDAPHECFRVYDSPRDSYEDHSKFLAFRPYYKNLFKLDLKDYKGWAHGLKKAGYATNRKYAYILISKIEKYKLYEFDDATPQNVNQVIARLYPDYIAPEDMILAEKDEVVEEVKVETKVVEAPTPAAVPKPKMLSKAELLRTIRIINHPNKGVKYVVIPSERISLTDISKKFDINEKKLLIYNDLFSRTLKKDQVIFLEPKKSRGLFKKYTVEEGETMYTISQKFAIKLKKLYRKNRMKPGQPIKVGQVIKLR